MTSIPPLVTVICLCYNQARFVEAALQSVRQQTYPAIELIAVDDASSDTSAEIIRAFATEYPAHVLLNSHNQGYCNAFNEALRYANGKYVIDLAADDLMPADKISKQVAAFEFLDASYGVVFTNAYYLDEQDKVLGTHFPVNKEGKSREEIPSGDIYREILQRYLVCTPTMMIRRSVLDELGGYDTSLSYEDFDFWVRSARNYKYYYLDEVLMNKRKVPHSLSSRFYQRQQHTMLASTLKVCQKAYALNQTPQENQALSHMIRYHLRQSFYTENFDLVAGFADLLSSTDRVDLVSNVLLIGAKWKLGVFGLYKWYVKINK